MAELDVYYSTTEDAIVSLEGYDNEDIKKDFENIRKAIEDGHKTIIVDDGDKRHLLRVDMIEQAVMSLDEKEEPEEEPDEDEESNSIF